MTIRVLLADDHAVVRAGLKLLVEAEKDLVVVAEAEDGPSTVREAERVKPDVVILDWTMPGPGGVETIRELRKKAPGARILVLTMHDDQVYLRAALGAGAAGYVVKKAADRDLLAALRSIHAGRSYIDVDLAGGLEALVGGRPPAAEGLSRRERQVLGLLALGHTNREVAEQLSVSVKSVETYRSRLRDKLGARSRADLVRAAMEAGLLKP